MSEKITVCGSMQFAEQMIQLKQELETLGWIVLTPDFSERSSSYEELPEEERLSVKKEFISNHFNRIRQSSAILVANYEKKGIKGYIGSNTLMEIAAAHVLQKAIYVLNDLGSQGCEEEVRALTTRFIDGDLKNLSQPNYE
jgi:hypothetical protein